MDYLIPKMDKKDLGVVEWFDPEMSYDFSDSVIELRENERGPPFHHMLIDYINKKVEIDDDLVNKTYYFLREEVYNTTGELIDVEHRFEVNILFEDGKISLRQRGTGRKTKSAI